MRTAAAIAAILLAIGLAATTGLVTFGEMTTPTATPTEAPADTIADAPGFGVSIALLGLLIALVLARVRQS